ncbi:heterokaryon incompatibility protein-domain-containing protein [Schizothecium vesticola]|uniref:Heterokaryon incompatibility protein-domain-containing protein n=1 Tax=Schizothecium vesticola TaxID=314040 RepID=A0AA40BNW6_9PEZI|nr:heterokaryon incompatibility protein-domain-containing protein [Schizothecium vesticola]
MRLLEVRRQRLEYFVGDDVPPYAILSHTWGKDEVLFEHIRDAPPTLMEMDGWKKVHYTCTQARLDGYDYVWIDTCCIDKSSSAELSEAINSMFKWYLKAAICYAYLSDVNDTVPEARFEDSRWFTRGWTLQELIAPSNVIFYDSAWKHITSRQGLSAAQFSAIQRVTNLPEAILRRDEELFPCQTEMAKYSSGHDYQAQSCRQCSRREDSLPVLDSYIFAERMSWAAKRETTRVEDRAYSLLGLFGVSMPLLYGEGGRAFLRLQEEILKQSNDQSVLVFARPHGDNREGLLAESPDLFAHSQVTGIVQLPDVGQRRSYPSLLTIGVTAKSIELEMLLCPCTVRMRGKRTPAIFDPRAQARAMYEDTECWIALLPYVFKDDLLSRVGIFLARAFRTQGDANRDDFKRVDCQALVKMSPRRVDDFVMSWSSDRGWNMDTGMNYYYDADRCLTKTVRLYLAPSTAIRSTVIGNAPGPGTGTAVSAATILKLPAETYRYIGGHQEQGGQYPQGVLPAVIYGTTSITFHQHSLREWVSFPTISHKMCSGSFASATLERQSPFLLFGERAIASANWI